MGTAKGFGRRAPEWDRLYTSPGGNGTTAPGWTTGIVAVGV